MSALSLKAKLLGTVTALGATAAVAGLGTFGTFTDTTTASTPVDSGIVDINLGAVGADNRLTVAATDVLPGDTIQRAFKLNSTNTTENLASITLTTTATTSSVLNTDANGLVMKIEKCSADWIESATPYTYTCGTVLLPTSGTVSSVLAERAVVGADLALTNLASTTAGSSDNLRMTMTLPTAATNALQDKASVIQFTFTGTQRAGTAK